MRSVLIFVFSFYCVLTVHGQTDNYEVLTAKAGLLHLQKNYKAAIPLYEQAFKQQQPDALTAYKAAGMYALDSSADKAFHYLDVALQKGWTEADWLSSDPYFDYLKNAYPNKWTSLKEEAFVREQEYEKTLSLPLLRKVITLMTVIDQKLRYKRAQTASDSTAKIIEDQIRESDAQNLKSAKEFIQKYGWPKMSQIGKDGQNNLWLIVQHADQDVLFQQTALAAMKKLIGTKEINMENYAFLYDRIKVNLNYKQLYGTQVAWSGNGEASEFRPILQEHLVDDRRKKIGLPPLQVYALTYGFVYNKVPAATSIESERMYKKHVQTLMDSARYFFTKKEFQKTYDYYNEASTFAGGMNNNDNFDAAIIFAKIAAKSNDGQYKSISLDFLYLLFLRQQLTRIKMMREPAFKVLYPEQRWRDMLSQLAATHK